MLTTILLFILCFQTIRCVGENWDLTSAIIVNQNGNDIFFPRYVGEKTDGDSSEAPTIIYKEAGDKTTLTYAFCRSVSDSNNTNILNGKLLEKGPPPVCPDSQQNFNRAAVRGEDGRLVPCGSKNKENPGYFKYSMYINLYIDKVLSQKLYIDEIKDVYKLVLYEYCYDKSNTQSMMYAYYDLDNPSLLGNEFLAGEQNYEFDMQKAVVSLVEKDEGVSYGKQNDYEPYEVAISSFIPFGHWKRSFYQWHNMAAMNKDLIPAWMLLLKNVGLKLSETTRPLKIYSGVYDELKRNGSLQYLPNSRTPIAAFWWLILYNKDKTQGVSLIMHNYSYAFGEKKVDPLCGKSVCGDVGLQGAIPQGEEHSQASIYCCPASTIATRYDFHQDDELLKFPDEYSMV